MDEHKPEELAEKSMTTELEDASSPVPPEVVETQKVAEKYIKVLIWPVFIAGAFLVTALYNENRIMLVLITHGILIILVLLEAFREKARWQIAAIAGAIASGTAALIVAIWELITDFTVLNIFNLFTSTAITAIFAGIITGFLFIVVQLIIGKKQTIAKGGEQHG
ncbi:MAG: hypothetical protein ABIG66_00340 [Candidatus Kerfeldbacteria bacterium]